MITNWFWLPLFPTCFFFPFIGIVYPLCPVVSTTRRVQYILCAFWCVCEIAFYWFENYRILRCGCAQSCFPFSFSCMTINFNVSYSVHSSSSPLKKVMCDLMEKEEGWWEIRGDNFVLLFPKITFLSKLFFCGWYWQNDFSSIPLWHRYCFLP